MGKHGFNVKFDLKIWEGSGADGMSFRYGPDPGRAFDHLGGCSGVEDQVNPCDSGLVVSLRTFGDEKIELRYPPSVVLATWDGQTRQNDW